MNCSVHPGFVPVQYTSRAFDEGPTDLWLTHRQLVKRPSQNRTSLLPESSVDGVKYKTHAILDQSDDVVVRSENNL